MSDVQSESIQTIYRSGCMLDGGELVLACGYVDNLFGYMVCLKRTEHGKPPQYERMSFHQKVSEVSIGCALMELDHRVAAAKR